MTMRIAVIGDPGPGKSTLAPVLAFRLGVPPVESLADEWERSQHVALLATVQEGLVTERRRGAGHGLRWRSGSLN